MSRAFWAFVFEEKGGALPEGLRARGVWKSGAQVFRSAARTHLVDSCGYAVVQLHILQEIGIRLKDFLRHSCWATFEVVQGSYNRCKQTKTAWFLISGSFLVSASLSMIFEKNL